MRFMMNVLTLLFFFLLFIPIYLYPLRFCLFLRFVAYSPLLAFFFSSVIWGLIQEG